MKTVKTFLLAAVAAIALAGSPAMASGITISSILTAPITDIQAADADAKAHNDGLASVCYEATVTYLETLPVQTITPPGQPVGVVSAFQAARDVNKVAISVAQTVQSSGGKGLIPQALVVPCGPFALDVQNDLGADASIVANVGMFNIGLGGKLVF